MTQIVEKSVYNRRETANYLGMAENTLLKLLNNGTIPHIRAGRRILVPKQALDEWLKKTACEGSKS